MKRRKGIGAALLEEMDNRWTINWESQLYTKAGLALEEAIMMPKA